MMDIVLCLTDVTVLQRVLRLLVDIKEGKFMLISSNLKQVTHKVKNLEYMNRPY
jgi:hypothetical protein